MSIQQLQQRFKCVAAGQPFKVTKSIIIDINSNDIVRNFDCTHHKWLLTGTIIVGQAAFTENEMETQVSRSSKFNDMQISCQQF